MFSKSQRRLLRKVVTSFHKSFKWISWKQREKNSEWKPDLIFTSSQWYSIHQSQYLCYIQYEPRKIQIKLQKMKRKAAAAKKSRHNKTNLRWGKREMAKNCVYEAKRANLWNKREWSTQDKAWSIMPLSYYLGTEKRESASEKNYKLSVEFNVPSKWKMFKDSIDVNR